MIREKKVARLLRKIIANGHNGLWYNLESYFANQGAYDGRVSLSEEITQSELDTLNGIINSNDKWSLFNNCSSFAAKTWNSVSGTSLSAGWINTPSNLKKSIKKHRNRISKKDRKIIKKSSFSTLFYL